MKLGILVVYLVPENDAPILDLHLAQIQKHTDIPFTIYAGTQRLDPKLHERLALYPHLKIPALAPTDLRNAGEHSYYLEQLVRVAIEDGATHLVTLHVDSFPIRSGWAQEFARQLSAGRPLLVVDYGPYTACLFFLRDFYLVHQPRLLLTADERASQDYKRFAEKNAHIDHSGVGYLYRAFCNGLDWVQLKETQKGTGLGSIYQDAIFHLHGTARLAGTPNPSTPSLTARALYRIRGTLRAVVPKAVRRWAWRNFGDILVRVFDRNLIGYSKQQLLDDPDKYLKYMRTGKR